jgi:hypothetical protein
LTPATESHVKSICGRTDSYSRMAFASTFWKSGFVFEKALLENPLSRSSIIPRE